MPAMTLAPGGIGGAVVSDNITVTHLLNIKRLAYALREPPAAAFEHAPDVRGAPRAGTARAAASASGPGRCRAAAPARTTGSSGSCAGCSRSSGVADDRPPASVRRPGPAPRRRRTPSTTNGTTHPTAATQ